MDEKWLMSIPTDAFRGHGLSRSKTKKGYKKSSISVKWELPHNIGERTILMCNPKITSQMITLNKLYFHALVLL
ncbi:hypothetical protein [Planococcus kocurii]|uniref:hypothetical protein n=1 Tax=Planococcus kocurii TaxID=1374 RepID=UPI00146FF1D9|nr:hypothetical protein [Planococcus kocurii]